MEEQKLANTSETLSIGKPKLMSQNLRLLSVGAFMLLISINKRLHSDRFGR